jgi:hypothetical protein
MNLEKIKKSLLEIACLKCGRKLKNDNDTSWCGAIGVFHSWGLLRSHYDMVNWLIARVEELYEEVISYRASINYHKWGEECRRLKEEKKQQKAHEDGLDAMYYTDGY